MGYYTMHKIRIVNQGYNTRGNLNKLLDVIEKISGYTFYIIGSTISDFKNEEDGGIKWYECCHDMKGASRFLPELEIQIKAKGEEGEVWKATYKDGHEYNYHYENENSFSDLDENEYFDDEEDDEEDNEESEEIHDESKLK